MNRTHRIVTVLAVLIAFVTTLAGCGGNSPTNPIITGTPTPTPTPASGTPTPTPTPKPGTTPTPTPVPVMSISVKSVNPTAGDVVIGQRVSVTFRITGVTSGLVYVDFSEDGVNRSSKGTGDSAQASDSLITCGISMQSVGQTKAIIFYYSTNGGAGSQVPGSTYMVTYNWVAPKVIISIRPGGAFEPRDSGTVPRGTAITYQNDDSVDHTPQSMNSGMVSCGFVPPSGVCTVVTYNTSSIPFRVSVVDSSAKDKTVEVHTFTVSP